MALIGIQTNQGKNGKSHFESENSAPSLVINKLQELKQALEFANNDTSQVSLLQEGYTQLSPPSIAITKPLEFSLLNQIEVLSQLDQIRDTLDIDQVMVNSLTQIYLADSSISEALNTLCRSVRTSAEMENEAAAYAKSSSNAIRQITESVNSEKSALTIRSANTVVRSYAPDISNIFSQLMLLFIEMYNQSIDTIAVMAEKATRHKEAQDYLNQCMKAFAGITSAMNTNPGLTIEELLEKSLDDTALYNQIKPFADLIGVDLSKPISTGEVGNKVYNFLVNVNQSLDILGLDLLVFNSSSFTTTTTTTITITTLKNSQDSLTKLDDYINNLSWYINLENSKKDKYYLEYVRLLNNFYIPLSEVMHEVFSTFGYVNMHQMMTILSSSSNTWNFTTQENIKLVLQSLGIDVDIISSDIDWSDPLSPYYSLLTNAFRDIKEYHLSITTLPGWGWMYDDLSKIFLETTENYTYQTQSHTTDALDSPEFIQQTNKTLQDALIAAGDLSNEEAKEMEIVQNILKSHMNAASNLINTINSLLRF